MNGKFYIVLILTVVMISCKSFSDSRKSRKDLDKISTYFVENKLSFFDPYELSYADGRFQGYAYETWIRNPENLKMVHETFKKIGYNRLFSIYNYSENCTFIIDVWKPCEVLIDSLILTYKLDSIESKYYREFWNRRKKENNDSIVYKILREVYSEVYQNRSIQYHKEFVNDTLFRLIEIKDFDDSLTLEKAKVNFEYLREIGMHKSAYNLLFERYSYQNIKWDRDELRKTLKTDTIKCCPQAFVEDDTK